MQGSSDFSDGIFGMNSSRVGKLSGNENSSTRHARGSEYQAVVFN